MIDVAVMFDQILPKHIASLRQSADAAKPDEGKKGRGVDAFFDLSGQKKRASEDVETALLIELGLVLLEKMVRNHAELNPKKPAVTMSESVRRETALLLGAAHVDKQRARRRVKQHEKHMNGQIAEYKIALGRTVAAWCVLRVTDVGGMRIEQLALEAFDALKDLPLLREATVNGPVPASASARILRRTLDEPRPARHRPALAHAPPAGQAWPERIFDDDGKPTAQFGRIFAKDELSTIGGSVWPREQADQVREAFGGDEKHWTIKHQRIPSLAIAERAIAVCDDEQILKNARNYVARFPRRRPRGERPASSAKAVSK